MLKNLSPEFEELARMPPISFERQELLLENLVAPVNPDRIEVAQEFLKSQGWKETATCVGEQNYSRGSTLGNLLSFHAENLRAEAILKATNSAILLSIKVDTRFQVLTIYNYLSLQAEMEDFGESVLTGVVSHRLRDQYATECGSKLYFDWTPARLFWNSSKAR